MLAMGLFNDHERAFGENGWGCPAVTSYNVTFSPRFDTLVIISNTPVNVASRMVAAHPGSLRIPGLRYNPAKECSSETRHLIDIESGAELIVTERPSGRQKPSAAGSLAPRQWLLDPHGVSDLLTAAEHKALALIPEMTDEIETLLAGLAVRLNVQDPLGRWAMGVGRWATGSGTRCSVPSGTTAWSGSSGGCGEKTPPGSCAGRRIPTSETWPPC
jgi:hypothetical protein